MELKRERKCQTGGGGGGGEQDQAMYCVIAMAINQKLKLLRHIDRKRMI